MASLSMILSSSNFSSRSDVFGNKLFNGRSLAMKGSGREWDGSKRVLKEARVKAKIGGRSGKVQRDPDEREAADKDDREESRGSKGSVRGRRDIRRVQGGMGRSRGGEPSKG
ncbi:hypothetical protein POTOM_009188 [Populus tomentosa]|uniref:Uncharacterized protein n=1 Tax=Populus tomentosa TaxID=118781 RepID=A0A8X8D9F1_POPTO|nr:hypothetical protein POTOM_009188 [Populus tomentosa]